VADFIARFIEHVTVVLSTPLRWSPEQAPEEMKRQVIADISSEIHGRLHDLGESRLFRERLAEWRAAYSYRGTGSSHARALEIDGIYEVAAPIPSEIAEPHIRIALPLLW